jgi:hypothetical protein
VVPLRSIEAHSGDRKYSSYSFLTSALEGGEWSASRPRFTPGERAPGTHCTGGWVGPTAGLDAEVRGKILRLCRGSNPDRPINTSISVDVPTVIERRVANVTGYQRFECYRKTYLYRCIYQHRKIDKSVLTGSNIY